MKRFLEEALYAFALVMSILLISIAAGFALYVIAYFGFDYSFTISKNIGIALSITSAIFSFTAMSAK